nr:ribonuclease H-like domain-containing protein [Tanacetum cinerariifolium]
MLLRPEFKRYGPKSCKRESKNASENIPNELKESTEIKDTFDVPLVKKLVSDDNLEKKIVVPIDTKIEFVKAKQQEKPVRKPVKHAEMYRSQGELQLPSKGKSVNTARPRPGTTARPVNTVRTRPVNTVRPRPVNNARPNSSVVNAIRANQVNDVKALAWEEQMVAELLAKKLFTLILLRVPRRNNMYSVDMKNIIPKESLTCLVAKATLDESMLWHRRMGHINFKNINKLVKDNLVRGLTLKCFENNQTCVACLKGKQHKASCIRMEFSVARTPQQNGVAERRNRTLIESARTMLADSKLPTTFWAKAVNTAYYVHNKVLVVKPQNKTPYELFRGRTHALSFMKPFGCHVTTLNTLYHLGRFDGKSDEGFFVGYSLNSKAFRVYNIRTRKVEENLHIRFLEDKPSIVGNGPKWLFDIDVLTNSMNYVPVIVDDNGVNNDSGIDAHEKSANSINDVNTVGPSINTASTDLDIGSLNINTVSPTLFTASPEATHADFLGALSYIGTPDEVSLTLLDGDAGGDLVLQWIGNSN